MTPTLQQFAEAFERVWAKYPDAPGLPEGYGLHTCKYAGVFMECPGMDMMPETPALALCVTTAMEIAAWWESLTPEYGDFGELGGEHQAHVGWNSVRKKWSSRVQWIKYPDAEVCRCWTDYTEHDSLPSATLAMLREIGGA